MTRGLPPALEPNMQEVGRLYHRLSCCAEVYAFETRAEACSTALTSLITATGTVVLLPLHILACLMT